MEVTEPGIALRSLNGKEYKLRDWLTSYPFLLVAVDPYAAESSWILDTATRILNHFSPADIRVGWLAIADDEGCRDFLGPLAERFLTFPDPNRLITKEFGIERLPSLVHVRADGFLQIVNGWNPKEWNEITTWVAKILAWSAPQVPTATDPKPYLGTTI